VTSNKPNHAFIDSQNLNLGVRELGWKIDLKRFRVYLHEKYHVQKAFVFIGYLSKYDDMYAALSDYGFICIFRPTLTNKDGTTKGNCDAELVLQAMIEYKNYDKAVIVSGDGDFTCLVEFLVERDKLLYVLTPNRHYSSLLRRFDRYLKRVDNARESLEKQK